MTSTEDSEKNLPILKTDTVGRVFTPAERRQQLLDEFERSGLSGAKFAALTGIKYSTFAAWRQRRGQKPAQKAGSNAADAAGRSVRWLEAVLDQAQSHDGGVAPALSLRLPGGVCLEIAHQTQIPLAAALLSALEKPAQSC